jgi:hypothetical protein
MNVINHDRYSIIKCLKPDSFTLLIDFLNKHSIDCPNVIINMLECDVDENKIVSNLLPFSLNWQKRNKSFILVSNIRKKLLKDIVSIKSLEEAIDFFHMEELTRNI